jgi:hypothetical protein
MYTGRLVLLQKEMSAKAIAAKEPRNSSSAEFDSE